MTFVCFLLTYFKFEIKYTCLKEALDMRVISGKAKGKKLSSLEGLKTRPTLDRVKEALFNIIQFDVENSIILDLFAGSGALRNRSSK